MAFVAHLSEAAGRFEIDDGETVLDAALRQGVVLDYGCRHGNCSKCKYYLVEGDVDFGNASVYSLPEEEREDGFGLMCCATPLTDLVIESRGTPDPRAKPHLAPQGRDGRVESVTQLTPALWELVVDLDLPLTFYAGQFVELKLGGTQTWRSYSIASDPAETTRLRFVIRHVEGGAFSGRVPTLDPGDIIAARGPYGTSYLRDGNDDVALIATGSGISPVLSILRDATRNGDTRRFALYYGARTAGDVPCRDLLDTFAAALGDRFSLQLSLSQPDASSEGMNGRVTQALQRALADASALDAYVCGAPEMCDTVGTLLEAKGIRDGHLLYDKFHAAAAV